MNRSIQSALTPSRSRVKAWWNVLIWCALLATSPGYAGEYSTRTHISIQKGRWLINGRPTNPDSPAEGLLMNVRMVNATFEDRTKHPEFDPESNTRIGLSVKSQLMRPMV